MITFNRWPVLYWGITLSFALLVTIPEKNFVLRSVSITLIAALSICYYVYKRYSKRLSIQADLLISINTLVQFLLPVLYLAFYYQANPHLDTYGYRYGYAITSFAILLGQTMFFWGYESVKKSIYFPRVQITEESYARLFLVLLPLLALIWIARLTLLSTGSYYHVYRTDYQFTSPFYSVFSQLSAYGLIIVGALFLIAFSGEGKRGKNKGILIALMVFILEILWYGPSGSREPIAMTILAPIFAYIFIKRKVPKITLAVVIIVTFELFVLLGEYRYTASLFYPVSKINIKATRQAFFEARERSLNTDASTRLIDRFYDGKNLGYLLMHYSDDYDYELGSTYKNIPFVFIPRFIHPHKPIFTTPLGNWYQLVAGGSTPTTFWGESYINFSWFGLILMSYFLGLVMKGYDYIFINRASKPYWMYLYIFSAIYIMRLPMEVAVIWVSFLLKAIVLAFIFTWIHGFFTKVGTSSRGFTLIRSKNI